MCCLIDKIRPSGRLTILITTTPKQAKGERNDTVSNDDTVNTEVVSTLNTVFHCETYCLFLPAGVPNLWSIDNQVIPHPLKFWVNSL